MSKKLTHVNGFKAPEDWYALVQQIADERHMTVGATIQYVFNLGVPIYDRIRQREQEAIAEVHREIRIPPQKKAGNDSP